MAASYSRDAKIRQIPHNSSLVSARVLREGWLERELVSNGDAVALELVAAKE
jgi:hypothetical protein